MQSDQQGALHLRAHLNSQRYRESQWWPTEQTETHQQWRPTRICSVAPALQRLHSRHTTNQLEEVRICRRHCLEHETGTRLKRNVPPVNLAKTLAAQIKWSQISVGNVSPERHNDNWAWTSLIGDLEHLPTLEWSRTEEISANTISAIQQLLLRV